MSISRQKLNVQRCGKHRCAVKQNGFVLVLALVMLAVLTLIGVSSMNSANMELKATANARQHQVAFLAVESLLEFAISKREPAIIDFQISDKAQVQTATTTVANASALSAEARLVGCSIGIGSSLEAGKGFSYNFFTIRGSGSNSSATAVSIQGVGVKYPAASC